jgi:hypothetical protein
VVLHGFRKGLAMIVLGETHESAPDARSGRLAVRVDRHRHYSCRDDDLFAPPSRALFRRPPQSITDPLRTLLFGHEVSAQHYSRADISPYFWVNGRAPKEDTYSGDGARSIRNLHPGNRRVGRKAAASDAGWTCRAMPKQTQITKGDQL